MQIISAELWSLVMQQLGMQIGCVGVGHRPAYLPLHSIRRGAVRSRYRFVTYATKVNVDMPLIATESKIDLRPLGLRSTTIGN